MFPNRRDYGKSDIVKLHYRNGSKVGVDHKNWGETKGEDHYHNSCVIDKTTAQKYASMRLNELSPATRNKLYVAITRAHGQAYLINDEHTRIL